LKTRYYYGYNIVLAGFLIQTFCIGAMFTYGVFFREFQQEFGWSRALISGASSMAFFVMGTGALITGTLNDKIGPRLILTVSGTTIGAGYLLLSQLNMPWQLFLLYGLFAGIGFSTHDVITLSTIARWFVKKRGLMSGIVKAGTGIGQFSGPLIASMLIPVFGWRNSYLIIGAVVLVVLVSAAQIMRRDPHKMGLQVDGSREENYVIGSSITGSSLSLKGAVKTRQFLSICFAEFAAFVCLFTIIVHIVPYSMDRGLEPAIAAFVLSAIGGSSMIGRIIMGITNDRIGGKGSLIICFMVLITSLILLQFTSGIWMLFIFAVVYGFAHGGVFTVMSPMIAEYFGMTCHGQLFGAVLFIGTIGATIGPILAGYLFDITGGYGAAFMALTFFAVAGFIPILFISHISGVGRE